MANQEHIAKLKQGAAGVVVWNMWREMYPNEQYNLMQADLSGAQLSGVNLREAWLNEAQLSDAKLREADLSGACLQRAYLCDADLSGADLHDTNLSEANLFRANLSRANLRGANLSRAYLGSANLGDADLLGANLSDAILPSTNLTGATLTNCTVCGISVSNMWLDRVKQDNLVITGYGEPLITVDNLQVAQFVYTLLNNQELRGILNAVIEQGVLLLGRSSDGGLDILQSIAAELRKMKYLPMFFDFEMPDDQDDFEGPYQRDYMETIGILAGLAKFVIVDLSGLSVPQKLDATFPHINIPIVTIIEAEREEHSIFHDLLKYPWVIPPVIFTDKEQLMELFPSKIIEPAESSAKYDRISYNKYLIANVAHEPSAT